MVDTAHSPTEIRKKFYRTFNKSEVALIDELNDVMEQCFLQIPPFVLRRMIDRGLIPDNLHLLDEDDNLDKSKLHLLNDLDEYRVIEDTIFEGMAFEFSNEGITNPFSPYRIVWTMEDKGFAYFVKTAIPPKHGAVRVLDVWRKHGAIPFYPLPAQKELFVRGVDWNLVPIFKQLIHEAKTDLLSADHEDENRWESDDNLDEEEASNMV